MNRIYAYKKGFEVEVDLEAVWETSGNITLQPLSRIGFIAVVQIRRSGATRPMLAPIRLMADNQRPFATEADALMAGFSAGQRVIDDTLTP